METGNRKSKCAHTKASRVREVLSWLACLMLVATVASTLMGGAVLGVVMAMSFGAQREPWDGSPNKEPDHVDEDKDDCAGHSYSVSRCDARRDWFGRRGVCGH